MTHDKFIPDADRAEAAQETDEMMGRIRTDVALDVCTVPGGILRTGASVDCNVPSSEKYVRKIVCEEEGLQLGLRLIKEVKKTDTAYSFKEVERLIAAGAKLEMTDRYGWAVMLEASFAGHADAVDALIRAGADFTVADVYGRSALHVAAAHNHADVVEVLVRAGADVNTQDKYLWFALLEASTYGFVDVVRVLINTGKLNVDQKGPYGVTALINAASHNQFEVVKLLVCEGKASVNLPDDNGNYALTFAQNYNYWDTAEFLRRSGAVCA
jgi:ankyrin repeat protein